MTRRAGLLAAGAPIFAPLLAWTQNASWLNGCTNRPLATAFTYLCRSFGSRPRPRARANSTIARIMPSNKPGISVMSDHLLFGIH
jgi:hypothetical protein